MVMENGRQVSVNPVQNDNEIHSHSQPQFRPGASKMIQVPQGTNIYRSKDERNQPQ